MGLALDVIYSRAIGWLPARAAERILTLLERLGFTLFAPELLKDDATGHHQILDGLEEFRQHLGGNLTITLLRGIGHGEETHEMDLALVMAAVEELRERSQKHEPPDSY